MVTPDPNNIASFKDAAALAAWMRKHHATSSELWLKLHKKGSGLASVSAAEALDVMLCWGWIDGLRKGFDDQSYLQRYTPRRPKSIWSQVNRDHCARLVKAGRMTPHGQAQIDLAKADGRWKAAYAPIKGTSTKTMPKDLRAAIKANAKAEKTFQTLNGHNLFALRFRTNNMKTAEGRARKIAALVAMLARGETIVPMKIKTPKRRGKT